MNNSKILLTGGSGFLGKHVYQELLNQQYEDIFIPRSAEYDLRNPDKCKELLANSQANIVVHLAATCGGIGANMQSPGKYFYDNMLMGLNIIEQSRLFNISKFVLVGTVCAYPKFCQVPFKEQDIWSGYPEETNAPYGVAKKSLFIMLDAYHKQYGLNSTVLVPSNLYGPYDNFKDESSHVIPALIKKIGTAIKNKDKTIEIWGDGSASREFLYAPEAAKAIVRSIKTQTDASPINIGSGEEITIQSLAQKLMTKMRYSGEIIWDTSKPNGQPRRCVDTNKALGVLGWKNSISIDEGLDSILKWYYESKTT